MSATEPDYKALFEVLSGAYDRMVRVLSGLCPECGAVREDNDCRACGYHSTYVSPVHSSVEGGDK